MSLQVSTEKLDANTVVLDVSGPLTLGTNLKILDAQLQQFISEGISRIVLNLAGCTYADSSGLGMIMHTWGLLQTRQGTLRLAAPNDRVLSLLRLTRTEHLFPVDGSRAESITSLA